MRGEFVASALVVLTGRFAFGSQRVALVSSLFGMGSLNRWVCWARTAQLFGPVVVCVFSGEGFFVTRWIGVAGSPASVLFLSLSPTRNPGCMGMCSMCFRDYASKQEKNDKEKSASCAVDPSISNIADDDELMQDADPSPAGPDVPRTGSAISSVEQSCPGPAPSAAAGGEASIDRMPGPANPLNTTTGSAGGPAPLRKKRCTAHGCRKRGWDDGFQVSLRRRVL